MRIDLHYGPQSAPEPRTGTAPNSPASGAAGTQVTPGEDQAVLSGAHVQVAALAAQASQLPEVREERVEALRQAVVNGGYQLEPQKIANAMMAQEAIRRMV